MKKVLVFGKPCQLQSIGRMQILMYLKNAKIIQNIDEVQFIETSLNAAKASSNYHEEISHVLYVGLMGHVLPDYHNAIVAKVEKIRPVTLPLYVGLHIEKLNRSLPGMELIKFFNEPSKFIEHYQAQTAA